VPRESYKLVFEFVNRKGSREFESGLMTIEGEE